MSEYKGEVWKVYRVNYETDKFEEVGTMYVDYDEVQKWLGDRISVSGVNEEWLRRFAEEHGMQKETLIHEVLRYVRR